MKNIMLPSFDETKSNIVLVGDIHGEFNKLGYDIHRMHKDAYIIQVGDFGMGFCKPNYYRDIFKKLNKNLEMRNCHLFAIRGNHDDPEYFKKTNNPFGYSNITLLQDYSELELLSKKILLVGGAVSIDRVWRQEKMRKKKHKKLWWLDEKFVPREPPYLVGDYDLVVTHTRPGNCGAYKGSINIEKLLELDPHLKDELLEERDQLTALWEKTKPANWVYGHFHESIIMPSQGTEFRCLDIDEHYQYYNNYYTI